mmetsp:Transcript_57026/g.135658  ORF Transcript_57026/g.135658 Transcript_57026/m.135658 type:complete len:514 (-) Transcript_57026:69-1610(-)
MLRSFCCTRACPKDFGGKNGKSEMEILEEYTPGGPGTVEVLQEEKHLRAALPLGPTDRLMPTFTAADRGKLSGRALLTGTLLFLKPGEAIEETSLAIYLNGFTMTIRSPNQGKEETVISRQWSPFSLVEKCHVKTSPPRAVWAVFKLTVFKVDAADHFFYFATSGPEAYVHRDMWVNEISTSIRKVTVSLFPPHAIAVRPVTGVEATSTRIMAGYLLECLPSETLTLYYCELRAYQQGHAGLAIYEDEWCERELKHIQLTDSTIVCSRKGVYCTVFGVDEHRFCARTKEEKELWLRAVSNVKVKLMYEAPDPTHEDLRNFRAAVFERLNQIKDTELEKRVSIEPLLPRRVRVPLESPRGDNLDPEPIDDGLAGDGGPKWSLVTPLETCDENKEENHVVGQLKPSDARILLAEVAEAIDTQTAPAESSPSPTKASVNEEQPSSPVDTASPDEDLPSEPHAQGARTRPPPNPKPPLNQDISFLDQPSNGALKTTAVRHLGAVPPNKAKEVRLPDV